MKLSDRIRNFFYALTHADQLIAENETLKKESAALKRDLSIEKSNSKETLSKSKEAFRSVLRPFLPETLSHSQLFSMYHHSRSLDPGSSIRVLEYNKTACRFGYIRSFDNGTAAFESVVYNNALVRMGVLSQGRYIHQINEQMREVIHAHYLDLPKNVPVGRIEWLGLNGQPYGATVYRDPADFMDAVHESDNIGEPMSIIVYSDPVSGKHIDTAWMQEMNPVTSGFKIEPYNPISILTADYTREELAEALGHTREASDNALSYFTMEQLQQAIEELDKEAPALEPEQSYEYEM